jgi:hypothetical protein
MSRRCALLARSLLALGTSAGALAAGAEAASGSYQVSACNYAPEGVNNSWTWSTSELSEPSPYAEHASCPYRLGGSGGSADQEGGLSTTDALDLSSGALPGTSGGWTFTAPAGTTIVGISYERYIGHIFDPNNWWSPALHADGVIVPGETCLDSVENGEACSVGGPPGHGGEPATISGLSAHQLTLGVSCQAPSDEECVTGAGEHMVWAALHGARVTLGDSTPPTLGTPSGSLWGGGEAGGLHKGTESVTVSAEDVGGGVQSILLSADGRPVETYSAPCDFTRPVPCPLSTGSQTLTLPTTELSDGTHTLKLEALDAAGNESAGASEQITVDNNPPPPPIDLSATATQAGGSSFIATWSDPSGQVAPITAATYQICPADGSGGCVAPMPAPAAGPTTVTVPGPGGWMLAVWLTNAAGNGTEANAAHMTLTVPAPGSAGSAGSASSGVGPTGSGSNGGGSSGSGPSTARPSRSVSNPSKGTLHLAEAIHGRRLVVSVSGPATGTVVVNYTARHRGRLIASGSKRASLHHGELRVTFRLSPSAAVHARIRVSARLVTSRR